MLSGRESGATPSELVSSSSITIACTSKAYSGVNGTGRTELSERDVLYVY